MWSIVGASLVAGAVLVSSAKKIVDGLPEDHVMNWIGQMISGRDC